MTINLFGREAVWGGEEEIEDDAESSTSDSRIRPYVADECHRDTRLQKSESGEEPRPF